MPLRFPLQFRLHPHLLPKELRGYFAHIFTQRTADALLLIATPVALFEFGPRLPFVTRFFSGPLEIGLLSVLLFFILERLTLLALARPLTVVFRRLGLSHAMMLGQFFKIAFLAVFPYIRHYPGLFFLAAFLQGISTFLYWTGHFAYFSSTIKPKHTGEEVGALEFLTKLAMVTAPLAAAFLVVNFGYQSVFLTGAGFSAASACLLLLIPNFHTKLKWRWSNFFENIRQKDYRKTALGLSGYAWEEIGLNTLWPVFLFVTFGRITTVSYILSGATLLSLLLVYVSGLVFDEHRSGRVQAAAGFFWGLLWLPRALFFQFPLALVATETLDRILSSVYGTFFSATMFIRSKQTNVFVFYVNREIILSLTLVSGFSLAILLLAVGWNWSLVFLSFLAGALASLSLRGEVERSAGAKL
jgi:MFS family permease